MTKHPGPRTKDSAAQPSACRGTGRRRLALWLLPLAALGGLPAVGVSCDRKTTASQSCPPQSLAELQRWCDRLLAEGAAFNAASYSTGLSEVPTDLVRIGRVANGGPAWSSPVVVVSGRGILVSRRFYPLQGAGSDPELRQALEGCRRRPPEPAGSELELRPWKQDDLQLAVAPDVSWRTVVGLSRLAKTAGYDSLTFLFEGTSLVSPPKSALLPDKPDGGAGAAAAAASSATPTGLEDACLAAVRQLLKAEVDASTTVSSSAAGRPSLAPAVVAALSDCHCRTNLEDVKALLWLQLGRADGVVTQAATIRLAFPGTGAPRLRQGPLVLWSQAHATVLLAADRDVAQILDAVR